MPVIGWTMIIFYLSTGNVSINAPIQWLSIDKVGHLTFYLLEVVLMLWAIIKSNQWQQTKHLQVFFAVLLAVCYGTSLEYVQASLPHRSFDYADMVANLVGAVLGMCFYYLTAHKFFISK